MTTLEMRSAQLVRFGPHMEVTHDFQGLIMDLGKMGGASCRELSPKHTRNISSGQSTARRRPSTSGRWAKGIRILIYI